MSVQLNRQSLGDIACLCVSAHTWRCWEPLYPVSGFVHIASKCCRRGGLESQEPVLGGGGFDLFSSAVGWAPLRLKHSHKMIWLFTTSNRETSPFQIRSSKPPVSLARPFSSYLQHQCWHRTKRGGFIKKWKPRICGHISFMITFYLCFWNLYLQNLFSGFCFFRFSAHFSFSFTH